MPYTLWSRGRLLGESDLGFIQVYENVRTGWFHPSPAGEKLLRVLTGTGPALMALSKMMRDPVRALSRGADPDTEPGGGYPRDVRGTTAYADLVSTVDELEAMQLELRDPDGRPVSVEHMGVDDTKWKISLGSKKVRRKSNPRHSSDEWEGEAPPLPRYQLQVHLRDIPRRRLHVPGPDD